MTRQFKWSVPLLATLAVACGDDGNGSDEDTDASTDTVEDFDGFTGSDSGEEPEDVVEDAAEEVGVDATPDVGDDTTPGDADNDADDGLEDVTLDAEDTSVDVTPDAELDATPDTTPDVQPDVVEPPTVDWCRLQFPTEHTGAPGSTRTVFSRVFVAGLTDLTAGNDIDSALIGEVGVGPDGSTPDDTWSWYEATANPGWTDESEPGNDEYQADLVLPPAPGEYDFAYRYTIDAGSNFVCCDSNAGGDSDGAADGYQPENAGQLTVVAVDALCDPNPCTDPGVRACDGDSVVESVLPGTCSVVDGAASCEYTRETVEDCATTGGPCAGGYCRPAGFAPDVAGEAVIIEIMLDAGADELASWFELTNPTGEDVDLAGCTLSHDGLTYTIDETTSLAADAYLVVGTTDDAATLGTTPDVVWPEFVPVDTEGTLELSCYDVVIDAVTYVTDDFAPGVSRQVGIVDYDPVANDFWPNWCEGESALGVPGSTPGAENRDCPEPPPEVENCWIQFPFEITSNRVDTSTIYSQVIAPGITDVSDATDAGPDISAQFGVGPDGSDPSESADWTWTDAEPNVGFSNPDGIDEYQYTTAFDALDAGAYDYTYRYSVDAGVTWAYCDRLVGDSGGAADGYQPDNAGQLTVTAPSPCEPNPCTEPPSSICEGDTAVTYESPGACSVEDDGFTCDYTSSSTDCAAAGGTCDAGTCTALPAATIGFCKIQFPTAVSFEIGETFTYYGRVYSEGITDRSTSTDPYGPLVIEWGFGAEADDVATWSWTATEPNAGYVGEGFTSGEDEYQVTVTHDSAGVFRFAFRASGDGGDTWTYCDISGASEDGSSPFDVTDAGTLTVAE